MIEVDNKDFNKIITDLIKDIALVFPDILQKNENEDIINILKYIEYELVVKKEYDVIKRENSSENINKYNIDEKNSENNKNIPSVTCNNFIIN